MGQRNYRNGFAVTCHEHVLEAPLNWKKPQTIFVNSMSDLFHEEIPTDFIHRIFEIMNRADWHRFQILTKRANRLAALSPELNWPANVWMGVTVENADYEERIPALVQSDANVKFLSFEPLLGPVPDLDLQGINWVIVGGESGPGARAMKEEWVQDIHRQCRKRNIPFFFKQWGGVNKKKAGRQLNGRTFSEMPLAIA